MSPSKIIPPEVLKIAVEKGYRLDPADPLETRYVDKHGCVLSELEIAAETPESLAEIIGRLHEK